MELDKETDLVAKFSCGYENESSRGKLRSRSRISEELLKQRNKISKGLP